MGTQREPWKGGSVREPVGTQRKGDSKGRSPDSTLQPCARRKRESAEYQGYSILAAGNTTTGEDSGKRVSHLPVPTIGGVEGWMEGKEVARFPSYSIPPSVRLKEQGP